MPIQDVSRHSERFSPAILRKAKNLKYARADDCPHTHIFKKTTFLYFYAYVPADSCPRAHMLWGTKMLRIAPNEKKRRPHCLASRTGRNHNSRHRLPRKLGRRNHDPRINKNAAKNVRSSRHMRFDSTVRYCTFSSNLKSMPFSPILMISTLTTLPMESTSSTLSMRFSLILEI